MNRWQKWYNAIRGFKTPRTLRAVINLVWQILKKFPQVLKIGMQAFEYCSFIETSTMNGLLKDGKLVEKIKELGNMVGWKIPKVVIDVIFALCVLAVKGLNGKVFEEKKS